MFLVVNKGLSTTTSRKGGHFVFGRRKLLVVVTAAQRHDALTIRIIISVFGGRTLRDDTANLLLVRRCGCYTTVLLVHTELLLELLGGLEVFRNVVPKELCGRAAGLIVINNVPLSANLLDESTTIGVPFDLM